MYTNPRARTRQRPGPSGAAAISAATAPTAIPICGQSCVLPGSTDSKESACNAGDLRSIPGLGRPPGEGNAYPLQCSGLENSMDCTVQGLQRVGHDRATFTHSLTHSLRCQGFPGGSVAKNLPANAGVAGDSGSIMNQEDLLEREMATHSSIPAWETPWTEEPGGLQPMASQGTGHNLASEHTGTHCVSRAFLSGQVWLSGPWAGASHHHHSSALSAWSPLPAGLDPALYWPHLWSSGG